MDTAAKVYGISLVESRDQIPPGTWAYYLRSEEPLDFTGPTYMPTDEEAEIGEEYRRLLHEEMNQPSAPITLEMLLEVASPDLEDPVKKLERERIIGSQINYVDIDDGKFGTIEDLRIETVDDQRFLVVAIKDETWFDVTDEFVSAKTAEWRFPISQIRDYEFRPDGGAVSFIWGIRHTIFRRSFDPRVKEARAKDKDANSSSISNGKFEQALADRNYDPRLEPFLGQIANRTANQASS